MTPMNKGLISGDVWVDDVDWICEFRRKYDAQERAEAVDVYEQVRPVGVGGLSDGYTHVSGR